MSNQKYICVDLDGTIAHYSNWQGEEHFGEPIEGVQAALAQLSKDGWKVIIFTTRSNRKLVGNFLNKHCIHFDYINENPDQPENAIGGKPYADAYIDDRGIQFNGDWPATLIEVRSFTPWESRPKPTLSDQYKKEAIAFLGRDFEESYSQFREYDKQIWDITQFSFLQLIGSIGAVWTVFALANGETAPALLVAQWKLVGGIILVISFIFSILAVQYIIRIRVYFAATARYINSHREFFLSGKPLGFDNRTNYYANYSYPKAYDRSSTQLISTYFIAVVSSSNLGFGVGLLASYFWAPNQIPILLGIGTAIVVAIAEIAYAIGYLSSKTDKSTDVDVFEIKGT